MASAPPKLRSDPVISEQRTTEGRAFVVKDPVTGRFFRLREAEHFIARQLDGATPLDVVGQRVEQAFGSPVAPETLVQFTHHLGRLGLLQGADGDVGPRRDRRQRVQGDLLYLRLSAFDPDRLFAWLAKKIRFCFTPHFVAFSGLLILLGCGITLVNWEEIGRDLARLYRVQALLLAWLTILLVTTAHESAHGLACKRFGGEVHELGVMLLYFQPAFYCNVSDAWLFPEKAKRLWVTFAGAYFELFLWAVATVTWRVTDPATTLNFAALVVMASSGVKSVFNLNPPIKLDGYYLLSDHLDVPNLRQRAFRHSGARIKTLLGSAAAAAREAPPRERRIYLVYGLLAGAVAAVEKAEERLKYAQRDLSVFRPLFAERIVSRKQLQEVEARVAVRTKELEEAQAEWKAMVVDDLAEARQAVALAEKLRDEARGKLTLLLAGSRREEIEATGAQIARSEAHRAFLEEDLQRVRVVSPLSGVMTTPRLRERVGEHVKKGDLIAQVHALETVKAEVALPEEEIADVKVGQAAVLKARAYPEKTFSGTVTAIAPAAVAREPAWAGKVVRVSTEIDNTGSLLKPEMTGNAKIFCGERRIFDILTRRLARYLRVEFWSWW